jgi:WD40 repeat protein
MLWQFHDEVFRARGLFDEFNERVTLAHHADADLLIVATGDSDAPVRLFNATSGEAVSGFPQCPSVQAVAFNPNAPDLALGHDNGSVSIWNIDPSSDQFCARLRILDVRIDAEGALISGATSLEEEMTWTRQWETVKGTRLEFLADCGAVLDEEQKQELRELMADRERTR